DRRGRLRRFSRRAVPAGYRVRPARRWPRRAPPSETRVWRASGSLYHSMRMKRLAIGVVCTLVALTALAQDFFGGFGPRGPFHVYPNIKYDGQFTFVRINYETAPGGYWYRGWPAWAHGYPIAEQNLMRIMSEVSFLSPHMEEIN